MSLQPINATLYEEKTWLQYFQNPKSLPLSYEQWEISLDTDLSLLEKSILNAIDTIPNINVRYVFNDDGDLLKYPAHNALHCFKFITEEINIAEYIEQTLSSSLNLEEHSPFYAIISKTSERTLLILVIHPIIKESITFTLFLDNIKKNYVLLNPSHKPKLTHIQQLQPSYQSLYSKSQISYFILEIFKEVLSEPLITENDDFFDYGGHSLLATRVIGELLQKYKIEISFNDFFRFSTANKLANYAKQATPIIDQSSTNIPTNVDTAPLSLAQTFLWNAYTAYNFGTVYNLPFAIEFTEAINESILAEALLDIVKRHAALRTLFLIYDKQPIQKIIPENELSTYKWLWKREENKGVLLEQEADYLFDLSKELPLRVRFLDHPESKHLILSFLVHHMAIDEWSLNTIIEDLKFAYQVRTKGIEPVWKKSSNTINAYAIWQKNQGIDSNHLSYWVNHLKSSRQIQSLLVDNSHQHTTSIEASSTTLHFKDDISVKLNLIAKKYHSSLFCVLYTLIASALQEKNNLDNIVIGTSASGRNNPAFLDTVGYFTTMIAHCIQFQNQKNITTLLEKITSIISESMSYADIPITLIQEEIGINSKELLFDVYIHIHSQNALNGYFLSPENKPIYYKQLPPPKNESMFGLHFEIMDNKFTDDIQSLSMVITYQKKKYSKEFIEDIVQKIYKNINLLMIYIN
ncbi:hypothetical protein F9B74_03050 [Pelistega sp. NLN82]|uniref:Carrier domain-containing protein n=1 Tax=Pelistega ratti TaxID=2652177 RepID=A0A6L9Y538_9BURK|nr:condensation domain-containing protein [Pelistega ratti]NEN75305.1 hypothetical protein [Pelistega ratti]